MSHPTTDEQQQDPRRARGARSARRPAPGGSRPASAPTSGGRTDRLAQHGARQWIPGGLVVLAVVAAVTVSVALGVVFVGAALVAVVTDLWIRVGIASQVDRDDEARARGFFLRRGSWPRD